jgi:hypothetical protein
VRHSQRSARIRQNTANHLPKELCVVWLPQKGGYVQDIIAKQLRISPDAHGAMVYDGDQATRIAEQLIRNHGLKPVLRPHYGRVQ